MTLTPCAAQADLHGGLQAALIVEKVRQVVVDVWHLERFPVCELLQQFLRLVWGGGTKGKGQSTRNCFDLYSGGSMAGQKYKIYANNMAICCTMYPSS